VRRRRGEGRVKKKAVEKGRWERKKKKKRNNEMNKQISL
jgi:hypothetical protein